MRNLLLRAEAADGSVSVNDDPIETYHVRIMIDAGLIEGRISEDITSDARRFRVPLRRFHGWPAIADWAAVPETAVDERWQEVDSKGAAIASRITRYQACSR